MAAKQQQFGIQRLDALFAAEPDRLTRFSFEVAGIYFDWSKTHLNEDSLHASIASAEAAGFSAARDALFSGEAINVSEGRPATHVAERGSGSPEDVDLATARRQRTRALIDAIEAGAFGNVTGVLHIGIGGSVLGPALLVDALGRRRSKLAVRFLSNIDGGAFEDAVKPLDPATTLVVVVSKSFTTAETVANMEAALEWLRSAGAQDPDGRVIAVTARPEAAVEAGVDESRIILDPGIGFGKTREHNLALINRLDEIRALGFPVLLGASRKSFIGFTLDLPADQRVEGTAATVAVGITRGADIIRVHDVKEMARVAKMTDAIVRE